MNRFVFDYGFDSKTNILFIENRIDTLLVNGFDNLLLWDGTPQIAHFSSGIGTKRYECGKLVNQWEIGFYKRTS